MCVWGVCFDPKKDTFCSVLTLCNPMDCSLSGSSVHGISQARILGWPTMSFSRGYSPPRDRNCASWFSACLFGYFSFGFLNMRNIYLILKWKRYVQSSLTFILPTPERQPCAVIPFITPLTLLRSHLRVWRPRS